MPYTLSSTAVETRMRGLEKLTKSMRLTRMSRMTRLTRIVDEDEVEEVTRTTRWLYIYEEMGSQRGGGKRETYPGPRKEVQGVGGLLVRKEI